MEKNKLYLIISSVIYSIAFFFIGGNSKLISINKIKETITAKEALSGFLSINNGYILFLFIIIGAITFYFFKEKKFDINKLVKNKNRTKNFKEIIMWVYGPMLVGLILNFLIKIMMFYSVKSKIIGEVSIKVVLITFIYLTIISLFIGALNILGRIAFKNTIAILCFPIFIVDTIIIIFSISTFLISEAIPVIKEIIEVIFYPILKLIDGFYFNYKFELMFFQNQLALILLLTVMTAVTLLLAYKIILSLSSESENLEFRSELVRKFTFITTIGTIVYLLFFLGGAMVALSNKNIELKTSLVTVSVISFILIPLIYIKVNELYLSEFCEIAAEGSKLLFLEKNNNEEPLVTKISNIKILPEEKKKIVKNKLDENLEKKNKNNKKIKKIKKNKDDKIKFTVIKGNKKEKKS